MSVVDVVVVNYNSGDLLRLLVAALQRQTFQAFRVIIIDNGSHDRSIDDLANGAIPVVLVRANANLGFAAANNLAIRSYVQSAWVALLNPDTNPEADWLECLLEATRAYPEYHFFGSKMLSAADPRRLDGAGDVYHVSGLHWRNGHGCWDASAYQQAVEIFAPCAAAALYRTQDVLDVGGFDEDFFCYAEDVDLAFRLRLRGHRCMYVPQAVVEHVGSAIAGLHSDFQLYHGHRNLVWVFIKDMPGWLFWIYLPYHLVLNLYSLIVFTFRGRLNPLWRAKRDALRQVRREWRKRSAIQSGRVVKVRQLHALMARGLPNKRCIESR